MIICGNVVRIKHDRPNVDPDYYGKRGRVHKRTRFLKLLGSGEYEIEFFDRSLNDKYFGVMGGFLEEDLEVVRD